MRILLASVAFLSSACFGSAAEAVSYSKDIRPILSNTCFKCHGPDFKKAGLDLQSFAGATAKLESGNSAIIPGKADESELVNRLLSHDENTQMPPKGERLKPAQIAMFKAWINAGAKYEEHWAYVTPKMPKPAVVQNAKWVRSPIDSFVLARLESEKPTPAPAADKAVFLRRVTLDLTGLPPTLAELDAFLADNSENAFEKVVDRLLNSTAYGEHMARWWLDLARYADTNGYEKDDRRSIWPYRDWVINAFNRDMPFDQFTIEQMAGDLLPKATTEQKVATGFHRNSMVNTEGGTDDEEFRVAAIIDRINTTTTVWLGSTFACAQCHNHKFDPFTTKEYYQLYAFFNNTNDGGRGNAPEIPVPTADEVERKASSWIKINRQIAGVLSSPIAAAALTKQASDNAASTVKLMGGIKPATTLVLQEMGNPRETHVQIRGNYKSKGEKVAPGVPAKLPPLQLAQGEKPTRLTFAKWLVAPENPLVGRVLMNRIWARYFGRGIVETSEDFGLQGELPSHPELLDYLATELIAKKWSLKAIQKEIVLSATYRQASLATPEKLEKDPYNRLFSRGPRFRLDAEMVRDNALAISGLLVSKLGGPSVFPYQPEGVWANPYSGDRWILSASGNQYRRGLYTFWRRTSPYAAFMTFDAPSREVVCERRPRTNTPLQALATLNDKAFVEFSNGLARRILTECTDKSVEARLRHGFRLCVAREPNEKELATLKELHAETLSRYKSEPEAARKLATVLGIMPQGIYALDLATWTVIANVLLNLDETITKG